VAYLNIELYERYKGSDGLQKWFAKKGRRFECQAWRQDEFLKKIAQNLSQPM
jgi:hypothetical protein